MNLLIFLKKPWLILPATVSQKASSLFLNLLQFLIIYTKLYKNKSRTYKWHSQEKKGLYFKNPLGIAGGLDKNAEHCLAWQFLGCGFVEVGTVTPQPQNPNPGLILKKNIPFKAVWNKMGFPSKGAQKVKDNLIRQKKFLRIPVFVNIGKNRTTPIERAHEDYIHLLKEFKLLADAFVLNISSPNTQGLRDLAKPENMSRFLEPLLQSYVKQNLHQPLFLKLSPDLDRNSLHSIIDTALQYNLHGFILTNTTLDRSLDLGFSSEGGVSGTPLRALSLQALESASHYLKQKNIKKMIISAGGVMTEADVFERIEKGADLVQVYSTLVFEGPLFFRKVAQFAKSRLERTTEKILSSSKN